MGTPPFAYQDPLPLSGDDTEYRLLSKEGVSTAQFEGREVLKVEPEVLSFLAQQAFRDSAFMLRTSHLKQLAAILDDPEASANDRYVALTLLKNAEIAAQGILPMCQDTGTAAVFAKKGEQVWTGANDAEWLSRGVYECFTKENLRYSQVAPLDMWNEVNTGTNLPAQIDIQAKPGPAYELLFVAKGGGSANKMLFFQETKALLNPKSFAKFVADKLPLLGTSACPPYHLVFVVGGTSAEACMKTLKLASTRYLDALPTIRQRARPGVPRRAVGGQGPRDRPPDRHRRPVRREVFRPRRPGHPHGPARRGLPRGHGRVLLRRPQHQGQDHPGRDLPREPRHGPGPLHPRAQRTLKDTGGVPIDLNRPMEEIRAELSKYPVTTRVSLSGTDGRRPRRRARETEGAGGRRPGPSRVFQEVPGLLRRARQDAQGLRLGLVRPDDGGAHGQLRRPVPVPRAARW
jgi:fumarate hydratase class I